MSGKAKTEVFAIVGMGCVFPNAFNVDHYWKTLVAGKVSFMPTPPELWDSSLFYSSDRRQPDKYYDEVVSFPQGFVLQKNEFNCPPEKLEKLSRREQYIYGALNECHRSLKNFSRKTKFFIGHTAMADFANSSLLKHEVLRDFSNAGLPAEQLAALSARLHKVFDASKEGSDLAEQMTQKRIAEAVKIVSGHSYPIAMVDAACASSLYTIDLAVLELMNDEIDLAICGGISFSDPIGKVLFCRLGGSSRQGVFPFQSRADGTVFGEGAGFVGIKKLHRAIADGDTIHAVVRGLGTASDGKGKSIYAPNSSGQVLAIDRAYKTNEISPSTIQYVEAHGTGTPAGDSVEFNSLRTFFEKQNVPLQSVGLGSVKGLFGHLGWAAGVASVIKIALCLKNKTLVGQHHFETVNPAIDLEKSPFRIRRQNQPWPENNEQPRRACINGFGFGGTNAHVIMEEYTGQDISPSIPISVPNERMAVVGVGCFLPEAKSWSEMTAILATKKNVNRRFPLNFRPDNIKFRIIDRSANVIDTTQFMLLEVAQQINQQLGQKMTGLKQQVGVFVAQTGCLGKQLPHMKRIYADAIQQQVQCAQEFSGDLNLKQTAEKICRGYKSDFVTPNEDSNPGIMPNVMAGRICNYFDFQGPNLSVATGYSTFTETLSIAMSNLRHKKCKIAIVATANASTSPAFEKTWEKWTGRTAVDLAEGAVAFAIMTEKEALAQNIPIMALLENEKQEAKNVAPYLEQFPVSPFGHFFSAPECHMYLEAVRQAELGQLPIPMEYCDDNETTWRSRISPAAGSRVDVQSPMPFFIDRVVAADANGFTCLRKLTPEKDAYLGEHCVRGKPTFPGTFMIEMSAQACRTILPDFEITSLTDIEFLKFMRPPMDVRVVAQKVSSGPETQEYEVSLLSDKNSPKGVLLQKDIKHFRCRIHLRKSVRPSTGGVAKRYPELGHLLTDPYHIQGSDVFLSGEFKTIPKMMGADEHKWGKYSLNTKGLPALMQGSVLAPLALDGALRLGAVTGEPGQSPVFPISIQKISVHRAATDLELARSGTAMAVTDKKVQRTYILQDSVLLYEMEGFVGQTADGTVINTPSMPNATLSHNAFPSDKVSRWVTSYASKPLLMLAGTQPAEVERLILADNPRHPDLESGRFLKTESRVVGLGEFQPPGGEETSYKEVVILLDLPRLSADDLKAQAEFVIQSQLKISHAVGQFVAKNSEIKLTICVGNSYPSDQQHPLLGLLRGFCRALYQETNGDRVRCLMTDGSVYNSFEVIRREMAVNGWTNEVLYRHGERFVPDMSVRTSFPRDARHEPVEGSVILFTGGGRGIGGYLSQQMAQRYPKCKIAILGRSSLGQAATVKQQIIQKFGSFAQESYIKFAMDSMGSQFTVPKALAGFRRLNADLELEESMAKLRNSGVDYEYYRCDVSDAVQVQQVVAQIYARFKKIDMVIHCAGVNVSKKLQVKTWAEFESNLKIKVDGFLNLLSNIKMSEVKHWINFGSFLSYFGSEGQTDYCAANDALNTMGQFINATSPECRVVTLNWPPWSDVGMSVREKATREFIQEKRWSFLSPEDAGTCFFREIAFGNKPESEVFFFAESDRKEFKPLNQKRSA